MKHDTRGFHRRCFKTKVPNRIDFRLIVSNLTINFGILMFESQKGRESAYRMVAEVPHMLIAHLKKKKTKRKKKERFLGKNVSVCFK